MEIGRDPTLNNFSRPFGTSHMVMVYPGLRPISANLSGDVFLQNAHNAVILRGCDFLSMENTSPPLDRSVPSVA